MSQEMLMRVHDVKAESQGKYRLAWYEIKNEAHVLPTR